MKNGKTRLTDGRGVGYTGYPHWSVPTHYRCGPSREHGVNVRHSFTRISV